MAAVTPIVERRPSVFVPERRSSWTFLLPGGDGSFLGPQPLQTQEQTPESTETHAALNDPGDLRRRSSEIGRRTHETTNGYRSGNSSAEFSDADAKFASLAHLVSAMNPQGMETHAKTAHHDAIVRHFQLRRVSGEAAAMASYAKGEEDDEESAARSVGVDGSLRTLFADRRHMQMLSRSHKRDSLRCLPREKLDAEVIVAKARAVVTPVSPTGTVANVRGVFMLVVVVTQLFVLPFTSAYVPTDSLTTTTLAILFDVAFLVDFLLGLNTTYYDDKTDRLELNRRKIVRRFLLLRGKRWVAVDILSAIPMDIALLLLTPNRRSAPLLQSGETVRAIIRFVKWQTLLPLTIWGVRVLRVTTTQVPVRLRLQRVPHAAHAACIVLLILAVTHYVACGWRMLLTSSDDSADAIDAWDTYIGDLSTAVELLVGHVPHHSPSILPSSISTIVVMVVGQIMMAFVTGSAALLLLRKHSNAARYEHKLAGVFAAMDKMQLPPKLRRRIHQYYDHLWVAHDATAAREITGFSKTLSPSLCLEVNLFKYMDLVLSVPFWRNCSPDFVTQIMLSLEVRTYLPEDYVMRQGEIGSCLFLINCGVCELRARVDEDIKSKRPVPRTRRLHAGAAFGELALLMNYRRTATVRAIKFVEMCILERAAFQTVLTRYRDDRRDVLREILLSCIEKKTQRFIPFPYEPLVASVTGDDQKVQTPWEVADVLVELILAPDCVDESIKFGFKDLDAVAHHRLIPVVGPDDSPLFSTTKTAARLDAMEQWQADTTVRLEGLEHGVTSILRELTSIRAALQASPTVPQ